MTWSPVMERIQDCETLISGIVVHDSNLEEKVSGANFGGRFTRRRN
jgi:hypothetical protein